MVVVIVKPRTKTPAEQAFAEMVIKNRSLIIDWVKKANGGNLFGITRIDAKLSVTFRDKRSRMVTQGIEKPIYPSLAMCPKVIPSRARVLDPIPDLEKVTVTIYKY